MMAPQVENNGLLGSQPQLPTDYQRSVNVGPTPIVVGPRSGYAPPKRLSVRAVWGYTIHAILTALCVSTNMHITLVSEPRLRASVLGGIAHWR